MLTRLLVPVPKGIIMQPEPFTSCLIAGSSPPLCEERKLQEPKMGNSAEEYEDSVATDLRCGRFVIADGAGQGIFSRQWADLLTQRWLEQPPDVAESDALSAWVAAARQSWREIIRYPELSGLHQEKVDRLGTGATLLALELTAGSSDLGCHSWRAAAVGDCCLFHVRNNELLQTFPVQKSADFGTTPNLIPTVRQFAPHIRAATAQGGGEPGDLYILATDAVAQHLLQRHESDAEIDWTKLWNADPTCWQQLLEEWRDQRQIVNDDSTLIMVRVCPGQPLPCGSFADRSQEHQK
jgi:hypothetical protein